MKSARALLLAALAVLLDGIIPAGTHAVSIDAAALPTGVYVVRLETPGAVQTTRLVVAHAAKSR